VTFGQELSGKYRAKHSDVIEFRNDTAQFNVGSHGGLIVMLRGIGKYEIVEDFIFIETNDCAQLKSTFTTTPKKNELPEIFITNTASEEPTYYGINVLDKSENTIWNTLTNDSGIAVLEPPESAEFLRLQSLGFEQVTIEYIPGFDYHINLVDGYILDNRTVVFQIHSMDDNSLTLSLFAEGLGKLGDKRNLKKFRKIAKRKSYRQRLFRK
jgi:hypothetical protein